MKIIALTCLLTLVASNGFARTVHGSVPIAPSMAVPALASGAHVQLAPRMVGASLTPVPAAKPVMASAMPVQIGAPVASANPKASLVLAQIAMTRKGSDPAAVSAQVFDQQGRHPAFAESPVAQPSAEQAPRAPLRRLQNRWIDPVSGLSRYGKIKAWPLGHILSVLTGRMFTRTAMPGDIIEISGFLTGVDVQILSIEKDGTKIYKRIEYEAAFKNSEKAAALIRKQYPDLTNIKPPAFKSAEEVYAWVAKQEAKFGTELPLVQFAPKRSKRK